jgi:hypothetical protein
MNDEILSDGPFGDPPPLTLVYNGDVGGNPCTYFSGNWVAQDFNTLEYLTVMGFDPNFIPGVNTSGPYWAGVPTTPGTYTTINEIYALNPNDGEPFYGSLTVIISACVPNITQMIPTVPAPGTTCVLHGYGFVGITIILINGISATFTVIDIGTIIVTIPPGVDGPITVDITGTEGSSSSSLFAEATPNYAPQVTQLELGA